MNHKEKKVNKNLIQLDMSRTLLFMHHMVTLICFLNEVSTHQHGLFFDLSGLISFPIESQSNTDQKWEGLLSLKWSRYRDGSSCCFHLCYYCSSLFFSFLYRNLLMIENSWLLVLVELASKSKSFHVVALHLVGLQQSLEQPRRRMVQMAFSRYVLDMLSWSHKLGLFHWSLLHDH